MKKQTLLVHKTDKVSLELKENASNFHSKINGNCFWYYYNIATGVLDKLPHKNFFDTL